MGSAAWCSAAAVGVAGAWPRPARPVATPRAALLQRTSLLPPQRTALLPPGRAALLQQAALDEDPQWREPARRARLGMQLPGFLLGSRQEPEEAEVSQRRPRA